MSLVHRHCRAVASALLVSVVLGAAPWASLAQGTMGAEARALERRSVELRRLRAEQRRSVERGIAHARMPDTMYASTPDPAPPPHSVPIDVKRPSAPERLASEGPAPPAAPSPGHRLPLLVSASGASEREGVVRLINRSEGGGEVHIEGYDDAGVRHGPVTLRLEAGEAVHLGATELERGDGAKGLVGRLGSGEGDWRLELTSALDLEVLGYVRTADGFLTAMHDVVPRGAGGQHRVVWFNPASETSQSSRLRLVNPGARPVEVRIEGRDDAGAVSDGAVRVTVPARGARTLSARELESGGAGFTGALGTGTGRWRLLVSADQPIEVMSLVASATGHLANLSSVPDNAVPDEVGAITTYTVPLLPAASRFVAEGLQGFVRIINHSRDAGEVRIEAVDDAGVEAPAVTLAIAAHEAVELTSAELEGGSTEKGLSGGIGTGEGDWWLRLSTGLDVELLAYVQSQDGFVSSVHDVVPRVSGVHQVGVFNPASETSQASRLRLVNPGAQPAEVRIEGIDDAGAPSDGALTLTLGGGAARTLGAGALESGDGEGLSGGLGDGTGRWRLLVTADRPIEVISLLASPSGHVANLSTTPGAAESSESPAQVFAKRISAPVVQAKCVACHTAGGVAGATRLHFEPASNPEHQALNLQAFEDFLAEVDDGADYISNKMQGVAHGGGVQVATGTPEFAAMEHFLGLLGEDVKTVAMVGTERFPPPRPAASARDPESAAGVFAEHVSAPIVQAKCVACHVQGGVSGNTRLVFVPAADPGHEARNLQVFTDFLDAIEDGATLVLNKVQGVGHGGGVQVAAGTDEFSNLERFLGLLGAGEVALVALTPQTLFDTVRMAPARKTLRRAALIFAGRIPTDAEYAAAMRGPAAMRATIRGLMTGPQFHEFLTRAANDRLLTDRNIGQIIDHNIGRFFVDFVNETYRRREAVFPNGKQGRYYDWNDRSQHGFRRAPVELIAHVAMNDRPYTEILTADYIMANPWAARGYGASTRFKDSEDVHEFKPSRIVSYYRQGDGFESEYDPVIGSTRIVNRGSLRTDYPHAGILNTTSFLLRYPTTATNRNRARSRWTYYHFLGLDIEKSASRTTDPVALADTNNPTLLNPACTVCHRVMDPVAGAFQNYGDEGFYKDKWGGIDSIDDLYKNEAGTSLEIRADSWRNRETLSWSLPLAAGTQTLRVVFANDFYEEDTGLDGNIFLDRLTVTNPGGRSIHSLEFENLEAPVAHWGRCGDRHYNHDTGRHDHFMLWGGHVDCAFYIDVRVPSAGVHDVEIVAWSNGRFEQFGEDGYARLTVAVNAYRKGDTWYRDMRVPGFGSAAAPDSDNSVRWLARRIVSDKRFAESTVKFWWPALMGSEVAEPPEDEEDADFEGLLLAANAQGAEVERLARGFRGGFSGGRRHNLKDLLVEIVLSRWFRADAVEDANPVRRIALRDAGARRLLTPEELARKTDALTGVQWERRPNQAWPYLKWPSGLTHDYRLLYGGIDSDGVTQRARDLTAVMAGVAKRHAMQIACAVVTRDFYLRTGSEQRLLAGVDKHTTAPDAIRGKLVELHDKLFGVEVTSHSPDVERAYGLFADVLNRKRAKRDTWFDHWNCYAGAHDRFFFEGLLDDIIVENENEEGHRWYDFDWNRVHRYLDRLDWSDPRHTAQAWVVTLAYLLMDYRYLYL